jgi:pimeloyl-ACP methyl ester carboxylesterase
VFLAEYRGYGGSGGRPNYASSTPDAVAALRAVRSQPGIDSLPLAIYGHSLGSAVAAELAAEHAPTTLILESPFTSARDMARRMLPGLMSVMWRAIARVHFDTKAKVAALDVPVWVVHGARDGVIPVAMGRAVHAAARRKGELLIVDDAGHNDVSHVADNAYWSWLDRALNAPKAISSG